MKLTKMIEADVTSATVQQMVYTNLIKPEATRVYCVVGAIERVRYGSYELTSSIIMIIIIINLL